MRATDRSQLLLSETDIAPQMNTRSCDVLNKSLYSSSAGDGHKTFVAFSCICNITFCPSSVVLSTIGPAEKLMVVNKTAFSGQIIRTFHDTLFE
ncbi:unnamed protein product [Dicrocoelium dendriticum]|nr:unnamed protein product [Dicrocoelium dendriticum]